ncbi:MAG: hypothetical protein ABFD75_12705 [Smithella sp.]
MINSSVKALVTVFTFIFSIACGLLLVHYLPLAYFKLFSPLAKTLCNFYIATGLLVFIIIVLDFVFFKMGKYNWSVWIAGTAVSMLVFGIPIFMLENNEMLWREAVFAKSGPVYFIEFSDQDVLTLKYFQNLYELIWDEIHLHIYAGVIVYLSGYFALWKMGWRIGKVRIK